MRDQWEYKILTVYQGWLSTVLRDREGVAYGDFTEQTLNRLGEEGWEVCASNRLLMSQAIILKRRRGRAE